MTDPERLLDGSPSDGSEALERRLLDSLRPEEETRARVWQRVSTQAGIVGGATAVGTALGTKSATGSAVGSSLGSWGGKAVLWGALTVPTLGGLAYWAQDGFSSEEPDASSSLPADSAPPVAPPPAEEPNASASAPAEHALIEKTPLEHAPADSASPDAALDDAAEASSSATSRAPAPPGSTLAEENALLRSARAALRAGDGAATEKILDTLDRRFPRGALLQERQLLRVQALVQRGSHERARLVARRFLELYPQSPYAGTMRALVDKAP